MTKKIWYFHPFIAALMPAIFLWSNDFSGPLPKGLLPALVFLIFFAGLVFYIFRLVFKDINKSSIGAFVFLLLLLSHEFIYSYTLGKFISSKPLFHFLGFAFSLVIFATVAYFIKRTKKDLFIINKIFFTVSLFFLLISFVEIGFGYQLVKNYPTGSNIKATSSASLSGLLKRDIYYIILDEHASPQVLKEVMGYNEIDGFVSFLQKRGFFIPKQSTSNYHDTEFSLPSSLNMRYLTKEELKSTALMRQLLEDHDLKDIFHSFGYDYLHFGTIWNDWKNNYADENIVASTLSDYQIAIWERTIFYPIGTFVVRNYLGSNAIELINSKFISPFISLDKRIRYAKDTLFKLDEISKMPERKGPNFIFVHFFIPHDPHVFDKKGNFLTYKEIEKRSQVENYLESVEYIDGQMEILVDKILEKSDPDPIIIIQGDHGARFLSPDDLDYKNLNAYYFPDGGDSVLYDTITPVNSFRVLLNYYFGQNLELLEDRIDDD